MRTKLTSEPARIVVALQSFYHSFHDIMSGIMRCGNELGGYTFRDLIHDDFEEIPAKLQRLRPAGAIVMLPNVQYAWIEDQLPAGLPLVNVGADQLASSIPRVCAHDEAMIDESIRHLREQGFGQIAFLGRTGSEGSQRRHKILLEKLPGLPVYEIDLWNDPTYSGEPESNSGLERWLKSMPASTGVITWHGHYGRCVCLACENIGRRVPEEIGVLSLFEDNWCISDAPTISAVRNNGIQLGYEAMKLLAAKLQGDLRPGIVVQVPPLDVITRDSTVCQDIDRQQVQHAVEYIERNATRGITVKEVLKATRPSSRTKFYEDFTKAIGRSPAEYIRQLKIARAKELLAEGTLTIARISSLCGFKDPAQFGETFRLETKTTPSAYKKRMNSKPKKRGK